MRMSVSQDSVDAPCPLMLHALAGFMDAGSAAALAVAHLLERFDGSLLAEWDLDDIYDYRARRPPTNYDTDHYAEMDMPHLRLHELTDSAGTTFLLLEGSEPDLAWRAIAADVLACVKRYNVKLTVGIHGIPWPAPHTRPLQITAHATDPALIAGNQPWVGEITIPGSLAALIELSLGEAGHDAIGFAAHVPHYLVNAQYPQAAAALLARVAQSTGLELELGSFEDSALAINAQIDEEVAGQDELRSVIAGLELQYDAAIRARETAALDAQLMSDKEIARAVEQFLADLDSRGKGE